MRFPALCSTGLVIALSIPHAVAFNAPANVPTWCGKPYQKMNNALDPGGQFQFPVARDSAMLDLRVQSRYSIFLESDKSGEFIVDATLSHYFGQPYDSAPEDKTKTNAAGTHSPDSFTTLNFDILSDESGALLVSGSVPVNSSDNTVAFSLASFTPRLQPYAISIRGASPDGQQTYSASTEIYVLPSRSYGSAVKIDNLYGGLYVQNARNQWAGWYGIFPNGGYGDGKHLTPSDIKFDNLQTYASQGFNTISIVPDGGLPDQTYPAAEFAQYWDKMDELNLFNVYEFRFAFQDPARVSEQVEQWKNRTTLLMWYTADEPDGWSYPLDSTSRAYAQLRELDPYHPVSLALNCQNFYYAEYSAGADIVYEDAYPVGINATWAGPWDTPCNATYGDCGCDNCVGELTDVATRLDDLQSYQDHLPGQGRKPTWAVIQAFGDQMYWSRVPTAAEVENMMMLSVNHNAKGITYWLYPSTPEINVRSGELGRVLQSETGRGFLLGANAIKHLPVVGGEASVDVSAWIVGGQMMVGFASREHVDCTARVTIELPAPATSVEEVLYGPPGWALDGRLLHKTGMDALEVGVLVLNLEPVPEESL
ncbi:hypothetical protein BUE80_DR011265 [Diplocarpon rosae]|nr:hypothetical protein BUE80_DR011265 [Diplocarpon rosae]